MRLWDGIVWLKMLVAYSALLGIVPLAGRGWRSCTEDICTQKRCDVTPPLRGRSFDVIPLGYPWGNWGIGNPYGPPFAGACRYDDNLSYRMPYVIGGSPAVATVRRG